MDQNGSFCIIPDIKLNIRICHLVTYTKCAVGAAGFRSGSRVGAVMRERAVLQWVVFVVPGMMVG